MDMVRRLSASIFGKVQGVVFRSTATDEARRLGLTGFVRNNPDGSVYLEAEGEEAALQEFLKWCQRGPRWARVDKAEYQFGEPTQTFQDFVVE